MEGMSFGLLGPLRQEVEYVQDTYGAMRRRFLCGVDFGA